MGITAHITPVPEIRHCLGSDGFLIDTILSIYWGGQEERDTVCIDKDSLQFIHDFMLKLAGGDKKAWNTLINEAGFDVDFIGWTVDEVKTYCKDTAAELRPYLDMKDVCFLIEYF